MPNNRKQKKLRGKKWKIFSHFKGYKEHLDLPCFTLTLDEDSDIYIVLTDKPIEGFEFKIKK